MKKTTGVTFCRRRLVSQTQKETHPCAAPGCREVIAKRFLMCGYHWQLLPYSIQQQIWNSFNPMNVAQTQDYFKARDAAINHIREWQKKKESLWKKVQEK